MAFWISAETEEEFDRRADWVFTDVLRRRGRMRSPFYMQAKLDWLESAGIRKKGPERWHSTHKQYDLIVMDPPWPNMTRWTLTEHSRYPRMSEKQMQLLPVPLLAAERCVLLMWVCGHFTQSAVNLINHWGFDLKGWAFVWLKLSKNNKPTWGYGPTWYPAKCTEHVLVAIKGKPPRTQSFVRDILVAQRREHSRKPEEFWEAVERWFGDTYPRRLEMFARENRPGWDAWGNEC